MISIIAFAPVFVGTDVNECNRSMAIVSFRKRLDKILEFLQQDGVLEVFRHVIDSRFALHRVLSLSDCLHLFAHTCFKYPFWGRVSVLGI
jgi:hypothetical protein